MIQPGGPSVHRKCVHSAHVHENGFSRPPGDFTYTPPFSRPYRGFHDFHVFFTYIHGFFTSICTHFHVRTLVFTSISCFHAHALFLRTHRHFRVHLAKRTLDTFFVSKWPPRNPRGHDPTRGDMIQLEGT